MMAGEYFSMSELHKLVPSFVPRPYAWGRFRLADPVTHFFLCEFIDMEKEMPDPVSICAKLAEIHTTMSRCMAASKGLHTSIAWSSA